MTNTKFREDRRAIMSELREHIGEEQSEQAKPDLFDHLAKHPDTVMAKEEQTNTIGE